MPFSDNLKAAAEKAAQAAKGAAEAATLKAADLADKHGDKVTAGAGTLIEKAGAAVDARTGGKYTGHIEKAKGVVADGVAKGTEKLADKATAPSTHAEPVVDTPVVTGGEHESHTHIESEDRNF